MSTDGVDSGNYQSPAAPRQAGACRRPGRSDWRGVAIAVALCGSLGASWAELPDDGRSIGQMCVQPLRDAGAPADCGEVEILIHDRDKASVRVSDIVYRLQLQARQLDVVLMHGTMQIDGFSADYDWQRTTLRFVDPEKGLRYRVDFAPPAAARRR